MRPAISSRTGGEIDAARRSVQVSGLNGAVGFVAGRRRQASLALPVPVTLVTALGYWPAAACDVLCFSDDGPDTGPHPISQEELRVAFNPGNGWNVAAIEPDRVQTRYHDDGAPVWFATVKRI
jgi:hypothetical protein